MSDLISFVNQSASTGANTAASSASLAGNFDTFLTLLTAQMQNQDPLEPLDASEFTNQLVQFSGVEQQIQTNTSLNSLLASNNATTGAALSGYLGQNVEINSEGAGFRGEDLSWRYSVASDAAESIIVVKDESGKVVYTENAAKGAGSHDFTWDGTKTDGTQAAQDAVYYTSITAKNHEGNSIETSSRVLTRVTGVDLSYGTPAITTNAGIFSYSDILRLTPN
ncbi:flagellar hook assembly protein FlgD [Hirschia litorea]|uniref:Basal-body rod modification protein FlgD n=1 Tax=Hirschia litorea TaxID=1199156 RepID=A0ABW2IKQ3_9PROT